MYTLYRDIFLVTIYNYSCNYNYHYNYNNNFYYGHLCLVN